MNDVFCTLWMFKRRILLYVVNEMNVFKRSFVRKNTHHKLEATYSISILQYCTFKYEIIKQHRHTLLKYLKSGKLKRKKVGSGLTWLLVNLHTSVFYKNHYPRKSKDVIAKKYPQTNTSVKVGLHLSAHAQATLIYFLLSVFYAVFLIDWLELFESAFRKIGILWKC